ncbi:MAG TPA: LemA family protein [Blastocatellia bacterium]|nr:LemA family protein [Blastocatellia bacterium]
MSNYQPGAATDQRDQFQQDYATQQNQLAEKQKKKRIGLIAVIAVVGILLIYAFVTYNSLSNSREDITGQRANIDTLLQRRNDLIPNLVATVKADSKQERDLIGEITEARARLGGAQTNEQKAAASDQMSSAISRLLVIQENYPDRKSNQNYLSLQTQLEGTENRISTARRDYNNVVVEYNKKRQRFPTVFIASVFGFQRADPFQAAEGATQVPDVNKAFDK